MISIDEAIENLKYDVEIDMYIRDIAPQLAEWLEELKSLKKNSIPKETFEKMKSKAYKKGHRQGYNKALDDFVKFASDMPTVEEEDGEIRPMWLEEMAERLKAGETE